MKLTSGARYLVDTNILIYSVNRDSPFYDRARELLEEALPPNSGRKPSRGISLVVAQQNLTEYLSVLTRGYGVSMRQAVDDARAFASRFEVIAPLPTTSEVFFRLAIDHKKIYPFDLYLAATMLDNGVERIITANHKDFVGLNLEEVVSLE